MRIAEINHMVINTRSWVRSRNQPSQLRNQTYA
jgi:hypothetical protein